MARAIIGFHPAAGPEAYAGLSGERGNVSGGEGRSTTYW
jgi:hypothetical protein